MAVRGLYHSSSPFILTCHAISSLEINLLNFMKFTSLHIYEDEVILDPTVRFYRSLHYFIRGHTNTGSSAMKRVNEYENCDDFAVFRVELRESDMIGFEDDSESSFNGRSLGRVKGIVVHNEMAFLFTSWIVCTGHIHPNLNLYEFVGTPLFQYTAQPLAILDHQRFLNRVYFAKLDI